jgi:hypothetical protein
MGLLDVLQNPAVEALLPAVLGAAGGALSSPRLAGGRGAIGRGLLGAGEGLTSGIQTAQQQQRLTMEQQRQQPELNEIQARTQELQQQAKMNEVILGNEQLKSKYAESLPEDQRAQFITDPKSFFDRQMMVKAVPGNLAALKQIGLPAEAIAGLGQLDPATLHDVTVKALDAHLAGRESDLQKLHDAYKTAGMPEVNAWKQAAMDLKAAPAIAVTDERAMQQRLTEAARPRPGRVEPGADGLYHVINPMTGADTPTTVKAPARTATTAIEKGDDGLYHVINKMTGEDTPTKVKAPATVSGIKMVPADDGFYHRVNLATGEDTKLDIKVPEKGGHLEIGEDGKYYIINPDGTSKATDVAAGARPTSPAKGADPGTKAAFAHAERAIAANKKVQADFEKATEGMPEEIKAGMRPTMPYPDVTGDSPDAWVSSPAGQKYIETYNRGRATPAATPTGPSASPKTLELPKGAVGKTVLHDTPPGKTIEKDGKKYVIKSGYVYPADAK